MALNNAERSKRKREEMSRQGEMVLSIRIRQEHEKEIREFIRLIHNKTPY